MKDLNNAGIFLIVILLELASSCTNQDAQPTLPLVSTNEIKGVEPIAAISGGTVREVAGLPILARGVCWSTSPMPTIEDNKTEDGSGSGTFISSLTRLKSNRYYYVRAYATNKAGTSYGETKAFLTLLTDIDGSVYHSVNIGLKIWTVENLRVTNYNDGTPIPLLTDNAAWGVPGAGYSWYDNDQTNYKNDYGALYNWYAVNTGKLCPNGWHVPTEKEWAMMVDFLGGQGVAGNRLKEKGTTHWLSPNDGATNETGYTALPGGGRGFDGTFFGLGEGGGWWTSTEAGYVVQDIFGFNMQVNGGRAWGYFMDSGTGNVYRESYGKEDGFSVKCVKN